MTSKRQFAIGIGAVCILAISGLMQAALAQNSTPVSVTFRSGFSGGQIGTGGDQIGSDSSSNLTYNNGGAVEVDFSSGGNLQFDTDLHSRSGGRMLAIAFENPVPGGVGCANPCPPPPPGSGTQAILRDAFMSTGHVTLTDNTFVFGLHEMPDPSDGVTDLGIGFNGWSVSYSASAFSSQLPVSRRGNTWTITATTQAAQLIKFSNNGKTQTAAGTFVMPTQITIICPSC